MDENEILKNVQAKIAIEKFQKKESKKQRKINIIKNITMLLVGSLSITSMVFATDISTKIYENKYNTGNGFGKAISEGYIEEPNADYNSYSATAENTETGEIVEDAETGIKVKEFTMDDFNLSMTFEVELSEKAQEIVNYKDIYQMSFQDFIIYDENKTVLFASSSEIFDSFCAENNLPYNSKTATNEQFIGSGYGTFPNAIADREENKVEVCYNFYTGGDCIYPKSKELNIKVGKIKASRNDSILGSEEITFAGNWNINLDVPAKFYNRSNISYVQTNTTNENYSLVSATVSETGTIIELKTKAKALAEPEETSTNMTEEMIYYTTILERDSKFNTSEIFNYLMFEALKEQGSENTKNEWREYYEKCTNPEWYLTNENGEKFETILSSSETLGADYNTYVGVLKLYGNFDLTKYDATDKIILHVIHNDNEFEIELTRND